MTPCDTSLFPRRLRAARLRHRFSQEDLGRRVDLVQQSISHYESGAEEPSLDTFLRLAWSLRVDPHWLRGYPTPTTKKEEQ